jgi:ATP-dependent Clp protease protease subunit
MKQSLEITLAKPDVTDRNLFFCKTVTPETIEDITKGIVKICEEDTQNEKVYAFHGFPYKRLPIKIYIDSYGGMVYQMFGLMSVIEKSPTPVHTIVTGAAMSAGFMILISGHRRFAYENSTPMYHQVSDLAWGKINELEKQVIEGKRLQKMIEDHVLRKTRITKMKLEEIYKSQTDWYMTAREAKKMGVVDEII